MADYGRLRRENAYYVDKTHYIPRIEAAPFYLFCIRPRRFGKSLWLSVLQHYYDVNQAETFDFSLARPTSVKIQRLIAIAT
ncbi:MAG: AAA family ATPase [Caldilineaceae bacterium]